MGTGALSLELKRPEREANHSPPSSLEVKECVELYLYSQIYLSDSYQGLFPRLQSARSVKITTLECGGLLPQCSLNIFMAWCLRTVFRLHIAATSPLFMSCV